MTADTDQPTLAVTQADRSAYQELRGLWGPKLQAMLDGGEFDASWDMQLLARHRTNSEPRPAGDLREALNDGIGTLLVIRAETAGSEWKSSSQEHCHQLAGQSIAVMNAALATHTPAPMAGASTPDSASDDVLRNDRDTAQSLVEAWASVCESLEAHLQDRVAMQDEANPAAYLSILRSSMANVRHFSEQVRAARWADYKRQNDEIERLRDYIVTPDSSAVSREDGPSFEALERFLTDHEGNDETAEGQDVDRLARQAVANLRGVVLTALTVCHSATDDCRDERIVTIDPDAFDSLNAALDRVGDSSAVSGSAEGLREALERQMETQDEHLPSSMARQRGLVWLEGWFDLPAALTEGQQS